MTIRKTIIMAVALSVTAVFAFPGPHGGPGGFGPRGPHHGSWHHHHGDTMFAIGAGVLGAGLIASTVYNATHPAPVVVAPTVVAPAPVVVAAPAPVVVTQPATVVTTGHYETRLQNVWVEGRYIDQPGVGGVVVRTWQPGHYEQTSTQVWVP